MYTDHFRSPPLRRTRVIVSTSEEVSEGNDGSMSRPLILLSMLSTTHLKNLSQSGARGMGPRTRNRKAICKPPRATDPSSAKHSNAHPLTLSSSCCVFYEYLGRGGPLLPKLRSVHGKGMLVQLLVCHHRKESVWRNGSQESQQCHSGSECIDREQAAAVKGLLLTI